ncbi:MAG: hypothetical protein IKL16_05670 [Clostridia bacterium]|nr:hypothetical protein [Clostridia bacterium]
MFTCLEILPENDNLFAKLYEKVRPPLPEREFVQVRGGTPFLRLKVRENHIDWRKISLSLTGDERKILTSLSVPESTGLEVCRPKALGLNMMLEAFVSLAEEVNNPRRISVSVYDRKGILIKNLEKLVPLVRNISVYTENIREYFYLSSEIMEEWGMCVKINEYSSHAFPEMLIIGDEYCKDMNKAELVFLGDKSVVSYNTVTMGGFILGNEYKALKGKGIDDFLFASSLYEYNGVSLLGERAFTSFLLAGKEIRRSTLIERFTVS